MGDEKGKRSKKFLHALHIFWEFLRKIWSVLGKPPKTKSIEQSVDHAVSKSTSKSVSKFSGKSIDKGVKTTAKKSVPKSIASKGGVGLGTLGISSKINSLLSTSSAASASSTVAGSTSTIGTILSMKTLAVVLVSSSIFLGGLGTYSYVNQEDPITALQSLTGNYDNAQNEVMNIKNPKIGSNLENSIIPALGPGTVLNTQETTGTSSDGISSYQSGNGVGQDGTYNNQNDETADQGVDAPSIDYTIP